MISNALLQILIRPDVFTARKRSLAKVMFSQACVKNSVQTYWRPPKHVRWQAGGTYPTGMLSCLEFIIITDEKIDAILFLHSVLHGDKVLTGDPTEVWTLEKLLVHFYLA